MSRVHAESFGRQGHYSVRRTNRRSSGSMSLVQGRFALGLMAAIMFVAFALGYAWTNHQSIQVGYEISNFHREQAKLIDLNRKYKVELDNLTALDRIDNVAKTQLGMVQPSPEQVQVVR